MHSDIQFDQTTDLANEIYSFNSYTQQICVDDAVVTDPGRGENVVTNDGTTMRILAQNSMKPSAWNRQTEILLDNRADDALRRYRLLKEQEEDSVDQADTSKLVESSDQPTDELSISHPDVETDVKDDTLGKGESESIEEIEHKEIEDEAPTSGHDEAKTISTKASDASLSTKPHSSIA